MKSHILILMVILLTRLISFGQTPKITSFSPTHGAIGTMVVINGQNLDKAKSLSINGINTIIISDSVHKIVCIVMPGTLTGKIKINTSKGENLSEEVFNVDSSIFPTKQQGPKLVGEYQSTTQSNLELSVALSADGNTAVIGSAFQNNARGLLYIFNRVGKNWVQHSTLKTNLNSYWPERSGFSVSISADGKTIVTGCPYSDDFLGAVCIFTLENNKWTQLQKISLNDISIHYFGSCVSLSADGNTLVVGAMYNGIWVFNRIGNIWKQQGGELIADGICGKSVAISADGNTIISGGPGDNNGQGAAWVFTKNNGVWSQQGPKLIGANGRNNQTQGFSVAISADGNTAVIGGNSENNGISQGNGAAWVFYRK